MATTMLPTSEALSEALSRRAALTERRSVLDAELTELRRRSPATPLAVLQREADMDMKHRDLKLVLLELAEVSEQATDLTNQRDRELRDKLRPTVMLAAEKAKRSLLVAQRDQRALQKAQRDAGALGARWIEFLGPQSAADQRLSFTPLMGDRVDTWLSWMQREGWIKP